MGEEFFFAPRLDNLASVWAGLRALERVAAKGGDLGVTPVLAAFDHEEVGSGSRAGADGSFLNDVVERICLARGGDRDDYHRAVAQSYCVSSDMAHATHPNYPEKHDPRAQRAIECGGGHQAQRQPTLRLGRDSVVRL